MRAKLTSSPLILPCALAFGLLAVGCDGPPASEPLAALEDKVISENALLLVPGDRWRPRGENRWTFHNVTTFHGWVREAGNEPLILRLRPNRNTVRHHFRFSWDDEEIAAEAVRQENGVVRVEIAPALLTPGIHRLTLERDYKSDAKEDRARSANVFVKLQYRYGQGFKDLDTARLEHYRMLAHFMQYTVLGPESERRGGLLFVGPARHEVLLERSSTGRLRIEPQNFSSSPAVFRLSPSGGETPRSAVEIAVELEPGERRPMTFELEKGANSLTLEVEGEEGGYFLWSMPVVRRERLELPPIVVITLDTTRRDALGLYNGRDDLTPNLDALARQATVYEQAFSTAPWTLPSHASIFTGLWPSKHRAGVSSRRLGDLPTLARLLRDRGYLTAGFSSGELSSSRFGLAQGFHHYRDPEAFETLGGDLAGYLEEFLDSYGDLPFFLFVNYFDPHALYRAPEEWEEKLGVPALVEKVRDQPPWDEMLAGNMAGWRRLVEGETEPSDEGLEYLHAAYLAEVAYTDHLLGRFFDQLRRLELYDRALIIVTADHGELLGEGGYFSHGARLDPELVEIPLIVKWPGQNEGRRSRRLASLVDLFPTVLRAAGLEPPPSDGRLLEQESDDAPNHPYVLLEEHQSVVHPLPRSMKLAAHLFGVQRPGFRQLVWDGDSSCARLNGDGGWRDEACGTPAQDVLAAIEALLGLVEYGDAEEVPDDLRESLEALGYM